MAREGVREGVDDEEIVTGATPKKKEGQEGAKQEGAKRDEKRPGPLSPEEKAALEKAKAEFKVKAEAEGVRIPVDNELRQRSPVSLEERALLEKLRERRDQIESRDRDLEIRDNLLRVGERRLDERIGELRSLEGRVGMAKVDANANANARYKSLVVMYENMKPKEAARVFDRLEVGVLIDLVDHMNPRKVSEILAAMDTRAAEKLTLALARRAAQGNVNIAEAKAGDEAELPRLPASSR